MSEAHPSKDTQEQPRVAAALPSERIKKTQELTETVRDTHARIHQAFDHTRQLLKDTGEIFQHNQARQERVAEQAASRATTAPHRIVDILLIEDSPEDVTLFRHALKESALSCEVTVLTQRSEVEAFVRQAASTAHRSPHLIIVDCMIPGMEAEDILSTVRTVPAYHHIPTLLFSSLDEEEGQQRCAQCCATAFVHKPGSLTAFVTAVATMVRRWGEGHGSPEDLTPK